MIASKLKEKKVIFIVRNIKTENFEGLLKVLLEEDMNVIEIALNNMNKDELFEILNEKYKGKFIVGAGTVLTIEDFNYALKNNVEYILTPNINEEILKLSDENNLLCISGFMTPSELLIAKKYKSTKLVKLFPASNLPLSYLKSLKGPISGIDCVAVGGVHKNNMLDYFENGFVAVGLGSSVINKNLNENNNFSKIKKEIKEIKEILLKVRV